MSAPEIKAILDELDTMLGGKGRDYSRDNIYHLGLPGVAMRLTDKIVRLRNLAQNGQQPDNESLEDTIKDIAGYAVIALLVARDEWPSDTVMVYLAGPIDDIDVVDGACWRDQAEQLLTQRGVACFNPLTAYELPDLKDVHQAMAQAVSSINRAAIQHCTLVLANLKGPGRGFGTIREIEYARALGKSVIVIGSLVSLEAHDVVQVPDLRAAVNYILHCRLTDQDLAALEAEFLSRMDDDLPF